MDVKVKNAEIYVIKHLKHRINFKYIGNDNNFLNVDECNAACTLPISVISRSNAYEIYLDAKSAC